VGTWRSCGRCQSFASRRWRRALARGNRWWRIGVFEFGRWKDFACRFCRGRGRSRGRSRRKGRRCESTSIRSRVSSSDRGQRCSVPWLRVLNDWRPLIVTLVLTTLLSMHSGMGSLSRAWSTSRRWRVERKRAEEVGRWRIARGKGGGSRLSLRCRQEVRSAYISRLMWALTIISPSKRSWLTWEQVRVGTWRRSICFSILYDGRSPNPPFLPALAFFDRRRCCCIDEEGKEGEKNEWTHFGKWEVVRRGGAFVCREVLVVDRVALECYTMDHVGLKSNEDVESCEKVREVVGKS